MPEGVRKAKLSSGGIRAGPEKGEVIVLEGRRLPGEAEMQKGG